MNGLKLTYQKISGAKKTHPIVILHGLFGNWSNNRAIANQLASLNQDIYLPNLRNHGTSPQSNAMTYNDLSSDIYRFVDDHNIRDPILIGHSMGGKTVMNCCLQRPDFAYAMVCIENSPNTQPINQKFVEYITQLEKVILECNNLQEARTKLVEIEKDSFVVGFLLTLLKKQDNRLISKVPLNFLKDNISQGNISGWPFSSDATDKNKHKAPKWDKPSLFIKGSNSKYMNLKAIRDVFPQSKLVEVEGSHFVNTEKPVEVSREILEFLRVVNSNH